MLRTLMILLSVGLIATMSPAGIVDGPHNMAAEGYDITNDEVCLPCHTPHGSSEDEYLWNQTIPADTAITVRDGAVLGHVSLMCMGCHDGVTAISASESGMTVAADAALGTDLSKDHPVGVDYGSSYRRAPAEPIRGGRMQGVKVVVGQNPDGTDITKDLPLYHRDDNGTGLEQVECATCHTPHTDAQDLLRVDNAGSALCTGCHTAQ